MRAPRGHPKASEMDLEKTPPERQAGDTPLLTSVNAGDFLGAFDHAPIGMALVSPRGLFLHVNEAFCELTGRPADELEGTPFEALTHPDDARLDFDEMRKVLSGEIESYQIEKRYFHASGHQMWVLLSVSLVRGPDEQPLYFVCHLEDVTARKPIELALEKERDLSAAVMDTAAALVLVMDRLGRIVRFNRAAETTTGYLRGEVRGKRIWDVFVDPADVSGSRWVFDRLLAGEYPTEHEMHWVTKSGERRLIAWSNTVLLDSNHEVEHVVSTGIDVTERRVAEEQLAHQALHDPLTNLPNRELFFDRLEHALSRLRRHPAGVAVLFVDLDNFKLVNDSLGHSAGDELLRAISERLQAAMRPSDTVARFGGDEFTILCEEMRGEHDAIAIAERVAETLKTPLQLSGREVFLTTSVGIALSRQAGTDAESLIRDADAAMYMAKERGRSRFEVFDEGMRTRLVERMDTENALRRAIERKELRVFYQPEISLETGFMTGVEALVRWEHPERGLLEPASFIPMAEETGLIVPIGEWVLREACRQAERWRRVAVNGDRFQMSVNLSPRQLAQPDLADVVRDVLDETLTDPASLCLEITESALMDDPEFAFATLRVLKEIGVRIAIDDFGKGFSSLSHLKQMLPVSELKIDRTFIGGLTVDDCDSAIVAAVMVMATSLGLTAVAEGVETAEQLAELRALGFDMTQGYYFARPQPPEQLEDLIPGRLFEPPD